MTRLFFVNRYFHPDHSATSQLLSDLAFDLAAAGHEVHIVTSQQRYDDPRFRLAAEETVRGVHVHRVPTTRFGRARLLSRAVDYLSFYVSAWRALRRLVGRDDVVVAMTDPPLMSVVAMWAVRGRGTRLVNWLQDVYPEVAVQLGVSVLRGPIGTGLRYLRNRSLRAAAANVVVGERMRETISALGVPATSIHVIHNWSDDEQISSRGTRGNPLRLQWRLDHKFVVGYSGNLGRAHEYDTVLAAAEMLRHDPRIVFVFIGGGGQMDELARIVRVRGLDAMFRFIPYQERELLKYSLGVPDIHWISLTPAVEGMIVPSKVYGIAAAGRPIIAITARDGEIARLVSQHGCGLVIEPGHAKELAEEILRLSGDAAAVETMGAQARAMLDAQFTRRQALARWRAVFDPPDLKQR